MKLLKISFCSISILHLYQSQQVFLLGALTWLNGWHRTWGGSRNGCCLRGGLGRLRVTAQQIKTQSWPSRPSFDHNDTDIARQDLWVKHVLHHRLLIHVPDKHGRLAICFFDNEKVTSVQTVGHCEVCDPSLLSGASLGQDPRDCLGRPQVHLNPALFSIVPVKDVYDLISSPD